MTAFAIPITLGALWPRNAVIVQRPPDDALDWLPRTLSWYDRSSAAPLPLAGALPIICHEAAVTLPALQLLRDCGLPLPAEIITYRDCEHMRALVTHQVRRGRRVGITYTSRRLLAPVDAYVNQPGMHAALNDKARLATLLPPDAVPRRRVVETADLPCVLQEGRAPLPIVLKASTRLGSGAGCDVAICHSPDDLEPAFRRLAPAEHVVIEEFHEFAETWCLHFAIGDAGVVYCGGAEQVCDEGGVYQGNWCQQGAGPGQEAIEFACHAARAGWSLGYRGFLGVDVGRTREGRWLAYDLNFRVNGSTIQVLLRDSVAREWGAACTRICYGVRFRGPFAAMVERLWTFHSRRQLVPLLAFDLERVDAAERDPICNLLATGTSREAVTAILDALGEAGFDLGAVGIRQPARRAG
ncbi:MAG TPA: hypothetical protein VEU27_05325 [Gemmatimonadales bacterium]|nr:hypothetical protein [Gemmatimonadales bacterium]